MAKPSEIDTLKKVLFGGAAPIIEDAQQGALSTVLSGLVSQAFQHTTADGQVFSTFHQDSKTTTVVPHSATTGPRTAGMMAFGPNGPGSAEQMAYAANAKPPNKGGLPSAPEAGLDTFGQILSGIFTSMWAPAAAHINNFAINHDFIPTQQEIWGDDLQSFYTAIANYQATTSRFMESPLTTDAIERTTRATMNTVGQIRSYDSELIGGTATTLETEMAIAVVRDVISGITREMEGNKCGYCGRFPCACGKYADQKQLVAPVPDSAIQSANEHNTRLVEATVKSVFTQQSRALAAEQLQKDMPQKPIIELIHLSPKQMFIAAMLSDWKQLPRAITSAILPNETGKKGASILLQTQSKEMGGNSIHVSMGQIGPKASEGQGIPMNFISSWKQPDWQQVASDSIKMKKRWGKTAHGTIPEIGTLTIASPAAPDKVKSVLPLAVRFPVSEKPLTGGAAALPLAIQALLSIQDSASKLFSSATRPAQNAEELQIQATIQASQTLIEKGVRAGVVQQKAMAMLTNIANSTDAEGAVASFAPEKYREAKLEEYAETAILKQREAHSAFLLAMHNHKSAQSTMEKIREEGLKGLDAAQMRGLANNVLDWTGPTIIEEAPKFIQGMNDGTIPDGFDGVTRVDIAIAYKHALDYRDSHSAKPNPQPVEQETISRLDRFLYGSLAKPRKNKKKS